MTQMTKFFDGFLWIDPSAKCAEIIDDVLPQGEAVADSTFPCRITTERRRVMDKQTGKRATRDWRTAHFLLWQDDKGAPDMGREECRSVFIDARAQAVDQIVVHGCIALISSRNIDFRQFGVREITSIPTAA